MLTSTLALIPFNPNFWDGVWWVISLAIAAVVVFVVIFAFIDDFMRHDHSGQAMAL